MKNKTDVKNLVKNCESGDQKTMALGQTMVVVKDGTIKEKFFIEHW